MLPAYFSSQNVTIRGQADPAYAGKVIYLYTNTDYITNFRQKETQDTIEADGFFELSMQTDFTQPVYLKVGAVMAQMFVEKDYMYGITLPSPDSARLVNADVELPVNIGMIAHDTTELNHLVWDYQEQFNNLFVARDERYLSRAQLFRRLDSLQRSCNNRYAKIKNQYFNSYVFYQLAGANASLSRGEKYLYENYILGKPILYHHQAYMDFFNAVFKGYLVRTASGRKGESLHRIVNVKADYQNLLNFVRFDKDLRNDTIRELVVLRELWDFHFNSDFVTEAVEQLVTQLMNSTRIPEHKQIAANMMAFFRKLAPGSPAPEFSAMSRDKKTFQSAALKGRWIYLNFFSTTNIESLKEMPKIAALKKKMGDKLVFVSVCLDDSVKTYYDYLRANPKFVWPIVYHKVKGQKTTAKEMYNVTGTEAYYLIDNYGNLVGSPALRPSAGIEFKLNVIFKIRQKNTRTGIR